MSAVNASYRSSDFRSLNRSLMRKWMLPSRAWPKITLESYECLREQLRQAFARGQQPVDRYADVLEQRRRTGGAGAGDRCVQPLPHLPQPGLLRGLGGGRDRGRQVQARRSSLESPAIRVRQLVRRVGVVLDEQGGMALDDQSGDRVGRAGEPCATRSEAASMSSMTASPESTRCGQRLGGRGERREREQCRTDVAGDRERTEPGLEPRSRACPSLPTSRCARISSGSS